MLILCNTLSKHAFILGKFSSCFPSHLCPFLSSFWKAPLLLCDFFFFHTSSVFSHFWIAAKNSSGITGFTCMFPVLFPNGSLFSCGSLVRICPQVIITLMYFLPVSISSCYLLHLRVQQIWQDSKMQKGTELPHQKYLVAEGQGVKDLEFGFIIIILAIFKLQSWKIFFNVFILFLFTNSSLSWS